jgi:FtsH-binding integral membrane protein
VNIIETSERMRSMIIWSGWGVLVAIIVFVSSLIMEILVESIQGSSSFYQQQNWPMTLALVISGVICWFLGKQLNKPSDRVLLDKETGEEVKLSGARHKLFFIKMEYWGLILIIIGIINLFK